MAPEAEKKWKSYEDVARYLLDRFATEFGLGGFEGKQKIPGRLSGTQWEIDAKGVCEADGGFMIVECRRYVTSRQSQERVGALAFRLLDTGAGGGIYVSPLGFQAGAKKVASACNIFEVTLNADSTPTDFTMRFLNNFMVGTSNALNLKDTATVEVVQRTESAE